MSTNLDKYRADLRSLAAAGNRMLADLHMRHLAQTGKLKKEEEETAKRLEGTFEREYQNWFSAAMAVIRQLLHDRLKEFVELYRGDQRRKDLTATTFPIQDWLNGVRAATDIYTGQKPFDDFASVTMRFTTQLQILQSGERRFESSLFDIGQLVQADLLDSELEEARELAKHGFTRAAGAVAGVVIEKHLGHVAVNHSIAIRKKHPTIGDLNDALKSEGVVDVPAWRQLQRLADIRNLCDHNRQREPTPDEIEELIAGAEKVTKTLY